MILIKNGTVHVGDGQILDKFDILIENNIIKKVEKNIIIDGAEIIDATNKEVFPGFIEPMSAIGAMGLPATYIDNSETSDPIMPELNIRYSVDPDEISMQEFYKSGITCVGLSPTNANIMGGQIAVFKTPAMKYAERYLKEEVALKCSVTNSVRNTYGKKDILPKTKMGIFKILENVFYDTNNTKEEDYNDKQKVIRKVIDGKLPLFIAANTKQEMDGIIHFMSNFKNVKYYITDAYEFYKCVDDLSSYSNGVIIGDLTYLSAISRYKTDLTKIQTLIDNNKLVSFTTSSNGYSEGREAYLWNAIEMYKAGINEEEIVKMMTINPAKMLGIDDVVGTITQGKHADIVIYSNNPIKTYDAHVTRCFVNGRSIF